MIGIRPHHVPVIRQADNAVSVRARVLVAEISGSETIVHTRFEGNDWISESHGVHVFEVGDQAELHIDVDRCLYFDSDGALLHS